MDSRDIIQRLLKEQQITFDEAMTLIGDIKTDEKMKYIDIQTQDYNNPFKPFTLFDTSLKTISTNEYPIDIDYYYQTDI